MAYSKNFYHFSFNRSSLVLTNDFSFDQLGVCGELTGWADGADIVMNFDDEKQVFWADVEFPAEGGFKLRADGAWTIQWGAAAEGAAATEGLLDGSANIKAPAGNYRLYVNLNKTRLTTAPAEARSPTPNRSRKLRGEFTVRP